MTTEIAHEIAGLWQGIGVEAAWQVTDLTTGRLLGDHVDASLPIVSVAKVPLALVAHRLADRGEIDLTHAVTLSPDGRSTGTTGIAAMRDPVTLSLRDAAHLALTISDNAAGDALWDALPPGAIESELAALGLDEIVVREPMRAVYDRYVRTGAAGHDLDDTAFDADTVNRATPRALVRMLDLIWTDRAASPESCATIRAQMGRQVWGHRLASAFPAVDIAVAGKTGTAGPLRHEIGVVTYPGGRRYAVALLTHSLTPQTDHRADVVIGEAARRAIHHLRRTQGRPA